MYPCENCGLPKDGKSRFDNSGSMGHECIPELKSYIEHLKRDRNLWQDKWTETETARVNAVAEVERLRVELVGARKMACDLCSPDVPLRPDGYHHDSDGSLQWCDARADEELRLVRPFGVKKA